VGFRVVGPVPQGLVVGRERVFPAAEVLERVAAVVVGIGMVRPQLQGLLDRLERRVRPAPFDQGVAAVGEHLGVGGLQLQRPLVGLQSAGQILQALQGVAEVGVGLGERRPQRNGPPEGLGCPGKIAAAMQRRAEIEPGLWVGAILLQAAPQQGDGLARPAAAEQDRRQVAAVRRRGGTGGHQLVVQLSGPIQLPGAERLNGLLPLPVGSAGACPLGSSAPGWLAVAEARGSGISHGTGGRSPTLPVLADSPTHSTVLAAMTNPASEDIAGSSDPDQESRDKPC